MREGSPAKIDYREKRQSWYPYSSLSTGVTGGPRQTRFPGTGLGSQAAGFGVVGQVVLLAEIAEKVPKTRRAGRSATPRRPSSNLGVAQNERARVDF